MGFALEIGPLRLEGGEGGVLYLFLMLGLDLFFTFRLARVVGWGMEGGMDERRGRRHRWLYGSMDVPGFCALLLSAVHHTFFCVVVSYDRDMA